MKRFDWNGSKLGHSIDFPHTFSFDHRYMNEEMARRERNGYVTQNSSPESLFMSQESTEDTKFKNHRYELFGMIIHHGYSSNRGHYYALIKVQNVHSNQSGKWAKFDDEKITLID